MGGRGGVETLCPRNEIREWKERGEMEPAQEGGRERERKKKSTWWERKSWVVSTALEERKLLCKPSGGFFF